MSGLEQEKAVPSRGWEFSFNELSYNGLSYNNLSIL